MKIKKIVFTILIISLLINSSFAQKYNAIESIVLKYPNFGSTEKLAERIQKDFTSEHDKARAIYSWIALNIDYDLKTFLDPPAPKSISYKNKAEEDKKIQLLNAETTRKAFRSRKAVCEGYSLLYAHLAALTGLRCQVIVGDARVTPQDIGRRNFIINHAWNKVQIDGKWIVVDATWGGGSYDYRRKILVKKFTPVYFDTDLKYFNVKHYPEDAMYKGNTGNKTEFLNAPLIYSSFIEEEAEILLPYSGVIMANEGDKIAFKIKNIDRLDDLYYLDKKEERMKLENVKEENGVLEFQITYSRKLGRFITLYLFNKNFATFKIVPKTT
ncbi:transglutaminase domain-containing protein [Flavobacterium hungaricum]|uniref:Transglutaminase n=1 Tax=Flavobacterium hungaricum TaxID=2082725 RepID=A0ABR9TGT0_9FLAO|nr:transglutaminase domain-containing protein [Flavobacterium hungaricum]MBE8723862.1 transglutaminase [Flavobacterium hungaricum]